MLRVTEQIFISIEDNGDGFDTTHQRPGTGIANITNGVDLYNGTVEVLSKLQEGCILARSIPIKANNKNNTLTNIIIVEDDPDDQEIMARVFSEVAPHCSITWLDNGKILVDLLQSFPEAKFPSLIVLDYNMPLMNGLETLKALEVDKRFNKIPKIIYSSSPLGYNKNLCYSANAKAYIRKGITMDDIKENVHEMLSFVGSDNM